MLGSRRVSFTSAAVIAAVSVAFLVLVAPQARAGGSDDSAFVSDTNAARADAGLPAYATAGDLASVAQGQAQRMAESGSLYHNPNLASEVDGWSTVGENVGAGQDVGQIQAAFMASPTHRRNILSGTYTEVGIATATGGDGRLYVSEVFRLPSGEAAAPVDEPAPAETAEPAPAPEAPAAEPAPVPEPAAAPEPAPPAPAAPAVNEVAAAAAAATQVVPPTTTPAHEVHAQLVSAVSPFKVVPVRNVSGIAWIAVLLAQAVLLAHSLLLFRRYRMGSGS
jgi:hypothetical protein